MFHSRSLCSLRRNRIWRIDHNYFHFDPTAGRFNVAGLQYTWDDGVFSVTLGPRDPATGDRLAYFHPMVSRNEFAIATRHLKDEAAATRLDEHFVDLGSRGAASQSAMHDYDARTGAVFFSQVATNGLSCWNVRRPLNGGGEGAASNHVQLQHNNETMVYPGDVNVSGSRCEGKAKVSEWS